MVKAKLKHLRMSPRKVRLVADLIRGMKVSEAEKQLKFCKKKAAKPLLKLLNSAVANAEHNFKLDKSNLYLSKVLVNQGPSLKRWEIKGRGRVGEIKKRSSHVTVVLDQIEKKKKEKKEEEEPEKRRALREEISEEEKKKEKKPAPEKKPKPRKGQPLRRIFRRKSF